ncbi:MAG: aldo/keto reductase [Actinomycetota bacterium]|nr:aldo/keto reductase [Actinomycetota bacterium]
MEHVSVHGAHVPSLGLGTWQLEGEQCRRVVADAVELGYRHLDTAQAYGNEEQVGTGIRDAAVDRDQLWLTTKVWIHSLAPDDVRRTTEESLRRLGSDYVDLLLVHWPVAMDILDATLAAMTALRDEGKVRHVGVSNFTPSQFERAAGLAPVVCNQVEYHPFLAQDEVIAAARKHDAMVTAYSPLARGNVAADPVLTEIGQAHGKTAVQVALRWLVEQDGVSAVPKASSRAHLESNLGIFDFALSEAEHERIAGLARGERLIDPPFAPDWDA